MRSKASLQEGENEEDPYVNQEDGHYAGDAADSSDSIDYLAEAADEDSDEILRQALQQQRALVVAEDPAKTSQLNTGLSEDFAALQLSSPASKPSQLGKPEQKSVIEISDSPVPPQKMAVFHDEMALRMARLRLFKCSGLPHV